MKTDFTIESFAKIMDDSCQRMANRMVARINDEFLNPKVKEPIVRPACLIDDHLYDLTSEHSVSDGWETTYRYEALEAVIDFYEAKLKEVPA